MELQQFVPITRRMWRPKTIRILLVLLVCSVRGWTQSEDLVGSITSALRANNFEQARKLIQSALQQYPKNAQLWTLQGIAFSGEGRSKEALVSFQRALSISPDYLPALEGAAQIDYAAGSKEAIPLLSHLLQLRPNDPTGHAMLAVLEYQQGNCTAATSHFEKAGAVLESQIDALHAYATCLIKLRRLADAVNVFEHIVTLKPDDARERHLLASIQLMAHKPHDATATLRPLLETNNPDVDTLELAATAYENAGDTPTAVATLRRAILLQPQNVNLYLDFANVSFSHQSFQVGIEVLTDGIGLQPRAAPLYLARGVLYD